MFRSIGYKLDIRQKNIESRKDKQLIAQEVIEECIRDFLGPSGTKLYWSVSYEPQQQQLLIETRSKTLASELLLRASEINTLLRQKNVYIKQLIVR